MVGMMIVMSRTMMVPLLLFEFLQMLLLLQLLVRKLLMIMVMRLACVPSALICFVFCCLSAS